MPRSPDLPHDSTAARLLIVDDEPNVRVPLVHALSLLGYSAEEAGSGHEALTLLEQASYDLMVLDMHMPGMDGVEVMHRARQLDPKLLIIVLTGHATLENAIAAVKMEAADYLRKPVSVHEVVATVARILQRHAKQLHRDHLIHVVAEAVDALRETETPPTSLPEPIETQERFLNSPPLTLDRQSRLVAVGDDPAQKLQLTEGEADVLTSLITHPNQVLSCRKLARIAWGQDMSESEAESVIRPHIFRLRRKLEANSKKPRLIRTVRGKGYFFASAKSRFLV